MPLPGSVWVGGLYFVLYSQYVPEDLQLKAANYTARPQKVDSSTVSLHLSPHDFAQGDNTQALTILNKHTDYAAADPNTLQ